MKKLMIAAAAAAMIGGVYADELCEESVAGTGCSVYNVKFTFKTLTGRKMNCAAYLAEGDGTAVRRGVWTRYVSQTFATGPVNWPAAVDAVGAAPAPGGALYRALPATKFAWVNPVTGATVNFNGVTVKSAWYDLWDALPDVTKAQGTGATPAGAAGTVAELWYGDLYWADNATRTLEGILWQCEANCFEGGMPNNGNGSGVIYFALWEKKTETVISYPVFKYYKNSSMDKFNWVTADETPRFNWMARYGAKAEKIGVAWNPTLKGNYPGWINAVGFGTFDVKNLRMKSVTGGAVGGLEAYVNGREDECGNGSFKIQVAYVCQKFQAWCCDPCYAAVDWVPAYGNWSLKYNASLSKGKTPLSKILPSYAVFSETGDNVWTYGYDNKGIFHWVAPAAGAGAWPVAGELAGGPNAANTVAVGFYHDGVTGVVAAGLGWTLQNIITAGQANSDGLDL